MRAAAAFEISVRHFGLWRVACTALSIAAVLVLMAWVVAQGELVHVLAAAAVVSAGLALWRIGPRRTEGYVLRWDTQRWHWGPGDARSADSGSMLPGRLSVAIDLGPWMLLKFVPDAAATRFAPEVWLPVQQWGLAPRWHGLRCALYGARAAHDPPETPAAP